MGETGIGELMSSETMGVYTRWNCPALGSRTVVFLSAVLPDFAYLSSALGFSQWDTRDRATSDQLTASANNVQS